MAAENTYPSILLIRVSLDTYNKLNYTHTLVKPAKYVGSFGQNTKARQSFFLERTIPKYSKFRTIIRTYFMLIVSVSYYINIDRH